MSVPGAGTVGSDSAASRSRSVAIGAGPEPSCNRCGFAVAIRPLGCKNPCPNCGTVYPLGDCSD